MVNDPISDTITRIRNGYMAQKQTVTVPHSRLKEALVSVLKEADYIDGYKTEAVPFMHKKGQTKQLIVTLKYTNGMPAIEHIRRISKPGLRRYANKQKLPKIRNGMGTAIISTSQGLMTDEQARKKGVGGEVMCTIY